MPPDPAGAMAGITSFLSIGKTSMTKSQIRRLGEKLRSRYDRVLGKRFLHFLHIGKTGGTAVKDALKPHYRGSSYRIFAYDHKPTLMDVPRGDKVFFFLRDPITRYVSAFYSRQRKGMPRFYRGWSPGERRAYKRFATANELALALSSHDEETRNAATDAMQQIQHCRSYWYWFRDEEYFLSRLDDIWLVGRQETLGDDFVRLKKALGLPGEVTLPTEDHRAHRTPGDVQSGLEEQARRNLVAWYAADYRFLDLCAEHAERINYRPLTPHLVS